MQINIIPNTIWAHDTLNFEAMDITLMDGKYTHPRALFPRKMIEKRMLCFALHGNV